MSIFFADSNQGMKYLNILVLDYAKEYISNTFDFIEIEEDMELVRFLQTRSSERLYLNNFAHHS